MGRCLIIAEAGVNHDGDPEIARNMIGAAARAGADAVKFQTFVASRLASPGAPKAGYQREATDAAESQLTMLRALELDASAHEGLAAASRSAGIEFLSTPFDAESADLLEGLGVARFKLPSGELTNHDLLRHVGAKGRPVLLSTGMAYLGEVEAAVRVLEDAGVVDLTLLHCTSSYPAEPADCNLAALETLRRAFGYPVGYSDHTCGIAIACAAAALGASVIEKHFTLDPERSGPDHGASVDPEELAHLVRGVRSVEAALGDGRKRPTPSEADTRRVARRSLVAARDLEAGTILCEEDLRARRPGTGIPPFERVRMVGRRLGRAIPRDELLDWSHLA